MSAPDRLAAIRERWWSPSTLDMRMPIATARQDLASLLAEVDRLRAEADRAHELASRVMVLEAKVSRLRDELRWTVQDLECAVYCDVPITQREPYVTRIAAARQALAPTEGGTNDAK